MERHKWDLVVHAGTGKTGTSSIQQLMNRNRDRLAQAGHLYPRTLGPARHTRLIVYLKPDEELADEPAWHRLKATDPATFRRRLRRRLVSEVEESGLSRVVTSEETIFMASDATHRRLRAFVDDHARSLRVVVYLRRQDDHLVSRYQQGVKVGETRRLSDRTLHHDYRRTYDYAGRLDSLQRILEPGELVVRRYERPAFRDGSLHADFLDAVGIDVPLAELELPQDINVSLDAESVEFLRLLNLHLVETQGARPGHVNHRELVGRLAATRTGPTLTLPEADLDEFMSQWEAGNQEVAHRYLGDTEGVLFRTARNTRGTTTEQRLDPARIDHFLEVAGLPGEVHQPLRHLAAREARRGDP